MSRKPSDASEKWATMPLGSRSSSVVSRRTLGRQVQEALRAEILFGHLPGGTTLIQDQICERFQVSRIPVRDALFNLVFEGFAQRAQNGSIVVTTLAADDLADVLGAEARMHGIATRRATDRASADEKSGLKKLVDEMADSMGPEGISEFAHLNTLFHREINKLARAPKLNAALRAITLHIDHHFLIEMPDWRGHSNEQHEELVRLMVAGEGQAAEELMYAHVWESGVEMIRRLPIYQASSPDQAGQIS